MHFTDGRVLRLGDLISLHADHTPRLVVVSYQDVCQSKWITFLMPDGSLSSMYVYSNQISGLICGRLDYWEQLSLQSSLKS